MSRGGKWGLAKRGPLITGTRGAYIASAWQSVLLLRAAVISVPTMPPYQNTFMSPQTRPHGDLPDLVPEWAVPAYLAILGNFLSLVCRPPTDFWQVYQSQQIFWTVPEEIKEHKRAHHSLSSVFCSSYLCGVRAVHFSNWKDVRQIGLCYGTTASTQSHAPAIFNPDAAGAVFGGFLQSERTSDKFSNPLA